MKPGDHNNAVSARRHALLADVAEHVAIKLIDRLGDRIEQSEAVDFGNVVADFLANHWKGQTVYIPGDAAFKNTDRDWQIFNDLRRGTAFEIAAKHGLSYVRVYQIHARCLAEWRARNQPDLFGGEDPPTIS